MSRERLIALALAERIAASVPSHVVDGWSSFGRAIHCLIRGDTRNSVHLGYYAELRAVLAIMASEGVGIFNRQHFIVEADGVVNRLCSKIGTAAKYGTHEIIWPIYNWWIQQSASLNLVITVITPGSRAIQEWFAPGNVSDVYLLPRAGKWLQDWGLDLKRMTRDLGARNASSYGPSAIHNWQVMPKHDAVEAIVRFWETFEPTQSSRFDEVDRLLLRRVLAVMFQGVTTKRRGTKNWRLGFEKFISEFLDNQRMQNLGEQERGNLKRFLAEAGGGEKATPLEYATHKSDVDASSFPIEMLSRAALLLRIATGSCGLHLNEVGVGWKSLKFWLNDVGIRRGFWEQGSYPEDPIDLWADVLEAIEELRFVDDKSTTVTADSLFKLEECERIGLWGLGV